MQEYEGIAMRFPSELRAHVAMVEIAVRNLHDLDRARGLAKRGLSMLPDEALRMELLRTLKASEKALKRELFDSIIE